MTNKYGVSPKDARTLDGIVFQSNAEMNRYAELKMLERAGQIEKLELQPVYELQEAFVDKRFGKIRALTYRADFRYQVKGEVIVEDVKGFCPESYKIKRKLFLKLYPHVNFREIKT